MIFTLKHVDHYRWELYADYSTPKKIGSLYSKEYASAMMWAELNADIFCRTQTLVNFFAKDLTVIADPRFEMSAME